MSGTEESKLEKIEDLEGVAGGAQERARVRNLACPKCKSNDHEVIQEDIFFRMKLLCKNCGFTWWVE